MGSFAFSCALTRTAILPGDKVYIIWWKDKENGYNPDKTTYNLMGEVQHYKSNMKFMDDLGGIDEQLIPTNLRLIPPIELLQGEYDDYGWIEDHDEPPGNSSLDWRPQICMIHDAAVDLAIDLYGKDCIENEMEPKPLEIVQCIAYLAFVTRAQLFGGDWLLGEQYPSRTEFETQRKLQQVISAIMHKQESTKF